MVEITSVVLILPNKQLVFQRRDFNTKISPGKLGFFGGHIEAGETPLEAIVREVHEETSLSVDKSQFTAVADYKSDEKHYHLFSLYIQTDQFDVYEGVGSETYSLHDLDTRDDLTNALTIARDTAVLTSLVL